jgi:hypothetical protein
VARPSARSPGRLLPDREQSCADRRIWRESDAGWVDLGALHAERVKDGTEETEAAQTAEATRWGHRDRLAYGGGVLRREEDLILV